MPQVRLPSDFLVNDTDSLSAGGGAWSLSGGRSDADHVDLYVGLTFDDFRHYDNLTAAKPDVTFQFFEPPTIDTSTDLIIYQPRSFSDLHIAVRTSS